MKVENCRGKGSTSKASPITTFGDGVIARRRADAALNVRTLDVWTKGASVINQFVHGGV